MENYLNDLNELRYDLEKNDPKNGPKTKWKIEGINLAIALYESTVKDYKVIKVLKSGGTVRTIKKNLTRNQARKMVREDMENNPTGKLFMLVSDRM